MLADDVLQLMQDFGSTVTLTRAGTATYNPATGITTNSTGSSMTARGVFINYADRNIDGTLVRQGDRRLLLAASGATGVPAVNDEVAGYKVLDVREIAPNGTAIAWACQVRR